MAKDENGNNIQERVLALLVPTGDLESLITRQVVALETIAEAVKVLLPAKAKP